MTSVWSPLFKYLGRFFGRDLGVEFTWNRHFVQFRGLNFCFCRFVTVLVCGLMLVAPPYQSTSFVFCQPFPEIIQIYSMDAWPDPSESAVPDPIDK